MPLKPSIMIDVDVYRKSWAFPLRHLPNYEKTELGKQRER